MFSSLPIFPLPATVLFPNVFLPLHIFEPRYKQMVADALAGDRLIGMVVLKPGYEQDYDGRPPVYPIGTAGVMTHAERLDDGRYNIVLRGIEKFQITSEEPPSASSLYRVARVTPLEESVGERAPLSLARQRLNALLSKGFGAELDRRIPAGMSDEDLVNALAQYLDFTPVEKLALLERDGPLERCLLLVEFLELRAMSKATGRDDHSVH